MKARPDLKVRWVVLFLSCVMMTGSYYCYDNPSALHSSLKTLLAPTTDSFERNFALLYTVYSLPNIILPFIGGFIVDKLGPPTCLIVFSSLILFGQILFAFGLSLKSWPIMLTARLIFGLGGENISVAQSALLAKWFFGGELALAFGVNLSISRLGSVVNDYVSPAVARSSGSVTMALVVGVGVCCISVLTAVLITPIDKNAVKRIARSNGIVNDLNASLLEDDESRMQESNNSVNAFRSDGPPVSPYKKYLMKEKSKQNNSNNNNNNNNLSLLLPPTPSQLSEAAPKIHLSDAKTFGVIFWLLSLSCLVVYGCVLPFNNVAAGILEERDYFQDHDEVCVLRFPANCSSGSLSPIEGNGGYNFITGKSCDGDVIKPVLPSSINEVCPSNVKCTHDTYVIPTFTEFDVDCSDDFYSKSCTSNYCEKQRNAADESARIMSIPYFMSAALSPLLGFVVDRVGYRAIFASFAPLILAVVHSTLAFTTFSPVLPLIGQGIAYALFASVLWPSVPLSVPPQYVGTAYGLITAIQNLGLAVFPIIVSTIYEGDGDKYIPRVEVFFVMCASLGVVVGVMLNVMDRRRGGKLNSRGGAGAGNDEAITEDDERGSGSGSGGGEETVSYESGDTYDYENVDERGMSFTGT